MTRTRFNISVALSEAETSDVTAIAVLHTLRRLLTEAVASDNRIIWTMLHIDVEPSRRDGYVPPIARMRIDGVDDD